jgi:signal recognition particle subunit SRP54
LLENLTQKLGTVFDKIRGRGALSEKDVDTALSEVRKALLDADVALEAVKVFVENTRKRAVGTEVLRSVTPGQMVIKVVHDELVLLLGNDEDASLNIDHSPPATILLAGLQGSGKTTTAGKLALWIKNKKNKKVLLASLDTYRPAAREQLRILGEQAGVSVLPEIDGETPSSIAKRARAAAKIQGTDILILDTAGRQSIDTILMSELKEITSISNPSEILLVADAMTGQDAVVTARAFKEAVNISGLILSRADGDARGGAAISMRHVTNCPIKFLGVGEKQEEIELFSADRFARRILGMGDVVGLVEKAAEVVEREDAEEMMKKLTSGQFSITDLLKQLRQIKKMGGMGGLMGMIPGFGKLQKQMAAAQMDDKVITHQEAVILSMTAKERENINLLNASRRKRIASGSGTSVQEVNRLIKQYMEMAKVMKKMGRQGAGGLLKSLMGGGMKGDPSQGDVDLSAMADLMKSNKGMSPGKLPGLGNLGNLPPNFPFGKKK